VHRAVHEPAARQDAVDRGDAEGQHAMPRRLLELPDPVAKRCETGRTRYGTENTAHNVPYMFYAS
jgi:hypothetical protein